MQVEAWLEDEENHRVFKEIEEAWRAELPSSGEQKYDIEIGVQLLKKKVAGKHAERSGAGKRKFISIISRWGIAAAIAGLLLIASFWIVTLDHPLTTPSVYVEKTSAPNEKMYLVLPDSSKIWLNKGSSIRYIKDFEAAQREVFLKGEAFFEVVPDADKPFIVRSEHIATKVLGTSFNVKVYPGEQLATVSIATGKVLVEKKSGGQFEEIAELTPQQQLVLDHENGKSYIQTVSISSIASWRREQLVFGNNTFGEVVATLEAYYQVKIYLENEELKKCRIMASFDHQTSLNEVLHLLSMANAFQYNIREGQVHIVGGKCN